MMARMETNEYAYGVTQLPRQKKPSFWVQRGEERHALASFKSQEAADAFVDLFGAVRIPLARQEAIIDEYLASQESDDDAGEASSN